MRYWIVSRNSACDTGERNEEFLTGLTRASGIETPTHEHLARKREKHTSNCKGSLVSSASLLPWSNKVQISEGATGCNYDILVRKNESSTFAISAL